MKLPSDFVSAWLSLLGEISLKWSRTDALPNREEQDLLRLSLGGIVILSTVTLLFGLATLDRNTAVALLTIARPSETSNPADEAGAWLEAVFWIINFVFWLYLSPFFVGKLYRWRRANRLIYRVFALVGLSVLFPVAALFPGYAGVFTVVIIPTAVAAIPNLEEQT